MCLFKCKFYLVFLLFFFINDSAFSQTNKIYDQKNYSEKDIALGGECRLIKSYFYITEEDVACKTFEIEVPKSGTYFLNAWVMGFNTGDGICKFNTFLNDTKSSSGFLDVNMTAGHSASLIDNELNSRSKGLYLEKGFNKITFTCKIPFIPSVDFIRLARTEKDAVISDTNYRDYLSFAKAQKLPPDYQSLAEDSLSYSILKVLPNPQGNYIHNLDRPFAYSYYTFFYFKNGYHVVFETERLDDPYASDPVMQLFNDDDPINKGNWTDNNSGEGYQAKIDVTIQYNGVYCLYIRSYPAWSTGTSHLLYNESVYATNIPFNNYGVSCYHSLTTELNYFTALASDNGDTRIWIEDRTQFPGLIVAQNDDYYGDGDFDWGYHSRIKQSFNRTIGAMHASAYSSYAPLKYCDYYMKCQNSDVWEDFPNLEEDDAIQSAPSSTAYNCISWSGGRVDLGRWFWPPDYGNPWYHHNGALASFDNFYNNKDRYGYSLCRGTSTESGTLNKAMNFTRSGATASNSCVALWANGGYTHASVIKPANDQPHGYDWESKPGALMRTFHPRDALEGSSYGSISKWYRWDGTWTYGTPPQNHLAKSSSTSQVSASLSESEMKKMADLISKIPNEVRIGFDKKYIAWKKTWEKPDLQIFSNPRVFAQSIEYDNFINYCKSIGKSAWLLLIDNFANGDELCTNAIADLIFNDYPKLMSLIVDEGNNYARLNGLIPSQSANWTNYCKRIIGTLEESDMHGIAPEKNEKHYGYDETIPDKVYLNQNNPNPFNMSTTIRFGLPEQKSVSLKIYNVNGQEVAVLIDKDLKSAGWHTVLWNGLDKSGNSVSTGLYFYKLVIGNRIISKKLLVIK